MDNLVLKLFIFYISILISDCLVLQKTADDLFNFYEVDTLPATEIPPIINLLKNNLDNNNIAYIVLASKNSENNNVITDDDKDLEKYFIIKSRIQILEIEPYTLKNCPNKSKNIVKWLNKYCEMHPECDKDKLNEELEKISRYLEA